MTRTQHWHQIHRTLFAHKDHRHVQPPRVVVPFSRR